MLEKQNEGISPNAPVHTLTVKRTYIAPNLVEYGSVAKLTQNGNGTGIDGNPTAGMMMVCL
jgi:hypothetical protein